MAKIIVDTNTFIKKLYAPKKQLKEFLKTMVKEKDYYCFTEQNIDEFFRNINKKKEERKKDLENNKNKSLEITEFKFFENEIDKEKYLSLKTELVEIVKKGYNEKVKAIESTAKELTTFFEQLKTKNFCIIGRTDEIINRAQNRHLSGNPPQSKAGDQATIGDEIIWESILQGINEDIVIVSSDKTFTENKDFLVREFNNENRKLMDVVENIEKARTLIELPKDDNLEKIETEEKEAKKLLNYYWIDNYATQIKNQFDFLSANQHFPDLEKHIATLPILQMQNKFGMSFTQLNSNIANLGKAISNIESLGKKITGTPEAITTLASKFKSDKA